jgi:NAD(P)H-dependent FMN reductase
MNLTIVSGSDRPGANALVISKYLQQRYIEKEVSTHILNLQDFPLSAVEGGVYKKVPESVQTFTRPLMEADGWVMVVPEYNGGYPGILKMCIDYLPYPHAFEYRPVALIGESSGAFGALRAVEQLQMVLGYRNAHIFPERVFIPRVYENFDPNQGINDEFQQSLLDSQIEGFIDYIGIIQSKNK